MPDSNQNKTILNSKITSFNWSEFVNLEHAVIQGYFKAIENESDKDKKEILKIGLRIIVDITNFIYIDSGAKENRTKSQEFAFLTQKKETPFKPVMSYSAELNKVSNLKLFLKCVKLFLLTNKKQAPNIFKKPTRVLLESFNYQSLKTFQNNGLIIPFSAKLFFRRKRHEVKNTSLIDELSKDLERKIRQTVQNKCGQIAYSYEGCSRLIKNYFEEISTAYFQFKSCKTPKKIVLGTHNKTFVRLLSSLVLQNEGEIISFAHGHTLQNKDDHKLWMDLILSSTYYEYSESLAKELKEQIVNQTNLVPTNLEIKHLNNQFQINPKMDNNFDLKKVKSVMVVGNAFRNQGFSSVTAFEPEVQANIELTILKHFIQEGKDVHYKQHPGGVLKEEITSKYQKVKNLKIVHEPFESIMNNYDLIVFYYTRTSTIKDALLSDKNILLLDLGIEQLCPISQNAIEKRCKIHTWDSLGPINIQ